MKAMSFFLGISLLWNSTFSYAQEQEGHSLSRANRIQGFYLLHEADNQIRLQKLRFLMGETYLIDTLGSALELENQAYHRDLAIRNTTGILGILAGALGLVLMRSPYAYSNRCAGSWVTLGATLAVLGLGATAMSMSSLQPEVRPQYVDASRHAAGDLAYLMGWKSWDETVVRDPVALAKLQLALQERFLKLASVKFYDASNANHDDLVLDIHGKSPNPILRQFIKKELTQSPSLPFEIEQTIRAAGIYSDLEMAQSFEGLRRVMSLGRRLADTANLVEMKNPSKKELKNRVLEFSKQITQMESTLIQSKDLPSESRARIENHFQKTRSDLQALEKYYDL